MTEQQAEQLHQVIHNHYGYLPDPDKQPREFAHLINLFKYTQEPIWKEILQTNS